MSNAQPTRKLTFIRSNNTPSAIATAPPTTAVILPTRAFSVSESLTPRHCVMRSRATAPLAAMVSPLAVPRTVVNAIAELTAKGSSPKRRARSGTAMFVFVKSRAPLVIAPRPR